jgi:RNA polymerase sigma-70 factor (ECF subfamily)
VAELPEVSAAAQRGDERDLTGLLCELPASQEEVILMLKVSGLTLEEVTAATRTNVGAVKQKAHRAYERLRPLIRKPVHGN